VKELLGALTLIIGLAIVAAAAAATPVGSASPGKPGTKAEQTKQQSASTPAVKH
jgi:hypothetical protein